jgi:hypothetical protein
LIEPKDAKQHKFHIDEEINLSDIDDEVKKRELLDLEIQIDNEQLTRGERRRLQNKRNVLRAKIKKEMEMEGHKGKVYRLQKKVYQQKKMIDRAYVYKLERDEFKNKMKQMKLQLESTRNLAEKYKLQRNSYYGKLK